MLNPEMLEHIKTACEEAIAERSDTRTWLEAQITLNDFRSKLFPSDVMALVNSHAALLREREALRDTLRSVKECRSEGKCKHCIAIVNHALGDKQ